MSSQYLHSNPLAEHNSSIALSSKDIPQNSGTGNMYQGQAGRAFVQGGGGMSHYYSFNPGNSDSDCAHARGSYAPVSVGLNSVATGGSSSRRKHSNKKKTTYRGRRRVTKCTKCKCDIIIGVGGVRRHSRLCKHKSCNKKNKHTHRVRQHGGSTFGNAAYSTGGARTEVTSSTIQLANPVPYTQYNSCHPVV
jgi:hypothetical protein